jgi:Queuine tRNA-ribosyltransferase
MFDCVFPSRTARFGTALVPWGNMHLKQLHFARDYRPIDDDCGCDTCAKYTRSYLHHVARSDEMQSGELLTVHNIAYQMRLMREMRDSIEEERLDHFVQDFLRTLYARERQEPADVAMKGQDAAKHTAAEEVDRASGNQLQQKEPLHASGYPLWAVEALHAAGINVE